MSDLLPLLVGLLLGAALGGVAVLLVVRGSRAEPSTLAAERAAVAAERAARREEARQQKAALKAKEARDAAKEAAKSAKGAAKTLKKGAKPAAPRPGARVAKVERKGSSKK